MFSPEPTADDTAGSPFDDLRIEQKIGEGGMAVLYLAVDRAGRRRVLKVPRRTAEADPVTVVAFENELRLARYLEDFPYAHMPVSRRGQDGDYLVMNYIEGTDLWAHLRNNGCLSEKQAVDLVKKIVRALAELHKRRIVHLDIKLSNVMLTPAGEIRLIDFGLANHLDLADHIYESFQEPKGTPAYIAPEQFFGVRDEPRSDIFSIGTMLFEMTTSRLPFADAHNVLEVISRIKRRPVSPRVYRPELSEAFASVVMRCLENLPDRRYATMDELYAALQALETTTEAEPGHVDATGTAPVAGGAFARLSGWLRRSSNRRTDHLAELKRWIAEHEGRRPPARHRIVAALDPGPGAGVEALNREILAQAFQLANMQSSIITVLTVLASQDVGMASGEEEQQMQNAAYQQARARLSALIAEANGNNTPVGIHIRTGHTLEGITSCVRDYDAELLIIGARERSAFTRFILGSTSYKVLTTIKCPIYIVQERTGRAAKRACAGTPGDRSGRGGARPNPAPTRCLSAGR